MNRIAAAAAVCLLLLTACGKSPGDPPDGGSPSQTAYSPAQIAWAVWESQEETPLESTALTPADPEFGEYLRTYYQLDPETVEDGYLRVAGGMSSFELAVLRFREGTEMKAVEESLVSYRDARAGDFTGYLPEQAALAESGVVALRGSWAALMLCAQPEKVLDAFLGCFSQNAPPPETPDWPGSPEEPPQEAGEPAGETVPTEDAPEIPEPEAPEENTEPPKPAPEQPAPPESDHRPPEPNVYDGEAVRAAWASGDESGLSEKSRAVLETAREVLRQTVTEEMSGYEKELAIHDWMLAWGSYDHDTLSHLEEDQGAPDNENPYGFLIRQKGICLGYASTFQLFMDLLDIECVTVEGTAHAGRSAHAWNLVRLDGEWYGVDVTWDDPSGTGVISEAQAHQYFNVTSRFLRSTDHQWDETAVPEAEGTALAWSGPVLSLPGA